MKPTRFSLRMMMIAMAALTLVLRFVVSPLIDYYRLPPETRTILVLLNGPTSIVPAGATSAGGFLKSIRGATAGPFPPNGIPIYIDPKGLDEAGTNLDIPVKVGPGPTSLRGMIDDTIGPLGLGYFVEDGLMTITSGAAVERKLKEHPKTARRR